VEEFELAALREALERLDDTLRAACIVARGFASICGTLAEVTEGEVKAEFERLRSDFEALCRIVGKWARREEVE